MKSRTAGPLPMWDETGSGKAGFCCRAKWSNWAASNIHLGNHPFLILATCGRGKPAKHITHMKVTSAPGQDDQRLKFPSWEVSWAGRLQKQTLSQGIKWKDVWEVILGSPETRGGCWTSCNWSGRESGLVSESRVLLLITQKPIERPGWRKGKLALFWIKTTEGRGGKGRCPSKGWLLHTAPPQHHKQGGRAFRDGGEGAICRNSTVSSDSHLQIGH